MNYCFKSSLNKDGRKIVIVIPPNPWILFRGLLARVEGNPANGVVVDDVEWNS
jgi:hypothetical protein